MNQLKNKPVTKSYSLGTSTKRATNNAPITKSITLGTVIYIGLYYQCNCAQFTVQSYATCYV